MAATLQGAFEIIDRASDDLKRMRDNAILTDTAFKKLGVTMDTLGSHQRAQGIERTARSVRGLGQETEKAAKNTDLLGRRSREADRHLGGFGGRVGKVVRGLKEFGGELFRIAKPGGMLVLFGTAIGVAGQAVGALVGGIVALGPRIADLTGLLAPAIAGITGFGAAAITAMTAFKSLTTAMKGGPGSGAALRDIGRPGAQLVADLRAARVELRQFRQAASGGIFTGLRQALRDVRGAAPQILPMIRRYSSMVGGLAAEATRRATSPRAMADVQNILGQGLGTTQDMGRGLMNVASAMRHVAVAAEPLTKWLSKLILGWTEVWKASAEAGRESGRLARFFERTRTSAEGFGHIVRNLWVWMRNLGRAARPLGEELYRALERTTSQWAKVTGTTRGRLGLIRDFNQMGDSIRAMGRLLETVAKSIFDMGSSRGLSQVADSLNRAVPRLEHLATAFAEAFGPGLARAIENITELLEHLAGETGPVVTLVDGLNGVLEGINGILRVAGPFKGLIGTLVGGFITARFLTKIGALTFAWRGVTAAAGQAAVAQAAAMGGGAAGRGGAAGTAAGFGLGALLGGGRGGRGGLRSFAGDFRRGGRVNPYVGDLGPRLGRGAMLGGAGRGALGTLGRGALTVGGRFVLPIMALQGLMSAGTAYGGVGNRAYAGVNAMLGGLPGAMFGGPQVSPEERAQGAMGKVSGLVERQLGNVRGGTEIDRINRQIALLRGHMQALGRQNTEAGRAMRDQLKQEIDARAQLVGQLTAEAQVRGEERGGKVVGELNQVYKQAGGGERGMAAVAAFMPRAFRAAGGRGPEGMAARRKLGRSALAGAYSEALRDPRQMDEYQAMERAVERGTGGVARAGQLFIGGKFERGQIKSELTMGLVQQEAERSKKLIPEELDFVANLEASGMPRGQAMALVRTYSGRPLLMLRAANEYFNARKRREQAMVNEGFRQQQQALTQPGRSQAPPQTRPRVPGAPGARRATNLMESVSGSLRGPAGSVAGAVADAARQSYRSITGLFSGRQGGGRLGGRGLQDTVPVPGGMAAPGELVVNRHTEGRVNAMLARHGRTLEGMTDAETRKHAEAPRERGGILAGLRFGGRMFAAGGRTNAGAAAVMAEANRMSALNSTYVYGGGHVNPVPAVPPWDCSASVSRLLQVGGLGTPTMTSGSMQNIGEPGKGWFTIYANPGHVYATIGGRAWGTSRSRANGGPGWFAGGPRPGFTVRHIPSSAAAPAGPRRRRRAGLRGRGLRLRRGRGSAA